MPEPKKNVLNFGYRANFKYEGMLAHSFDRFYVVTKFEMAKIEDLKLTTFTFDLTCSHLVNDKDIYAKILKTLSKKSTLCQILSETNRILQLDSL